VATLTFDKLAYVDRLKAAGMGEREARALAEGLDQALREEVATKTDLAAVKTGLAADIAAVKTELAADIAAVKTDVATVRTELVAVEYKLQVEIQTAKHDVLRWMVGMAFAQAGLTVGLIRFLPH
jgi:glyceraldehyde-3-phosphate dehydrogenase/erythrose-4-phosphate dehydrogenase